MSTLINTAKRYIRAFLKHVPGFRSGEKINMIVASLYYISNLLFGIYIIIFHGGDKIGMVGSGFLFPFLIFSFTDSMNNK